VGATAYGYHVPDQPDFVMVVARVIHTRLDLQRGLLAGVTLFQAVNLTFYELNLGWVTPTYILALGASY
jgi:hypothetical protein